MRPEDKLPKDAPKRCRTSWGRKMGVTHQSDVVQTQRMSQRRRRTPRCTEKRGLPAAPGGRSFEKISSSSWPPEGTVPCLFLVGHQRQVWSSMDSASPRHSAGASAPWTPAAELPGAVFQPSVSTPHLSCPSLGLTEAGLRLLCGALGQPGVLAPRPLLLLCGHCLGPYSKIGHRVHGSLPDRGHLSHSHVEWTALLVLKNVQIQGHAWGVKVIMVVIHLYQKHNF